MASSIDSIEILDDQPLAYPWVTLRVKTTDVDELRLECSPLPVLSVSTSGDAYCTVDVSAGDGTKSITIDGYLAGVKSANQKSVAVTVDSSAATESLLNNLSAVYSQEKEGVLYALISACAIWTGHVVASIRRLQAEFNISASRGRWLSLWGKYFGVARKSGENDEDFARRIVPTVTAGKNTLLAMKKAIRELTNVSFTLAELEGYPNFVYADLSAIDSSTVENVKVTIDRVKPAGIKIVLKNPH